MTAGALRQRLAARIAGQTSYTLAEQLLGVTNAPRTAKSPVFDVRLTTSEPLGRQRSGAAGAHLVRRGLEVRVLTQGKPNREVEQWDAAEEHEARVRRAVLTRGAADGLECVDNIVWLGSDAPAYPDGGAWREAVQRYLVDYTESLE